jgi:hypothetical protein
MVRQRDSHCHIEHGGATDCEHLGPDIGVVTQCDFLFRRDSLQDALAEATVFSHQFEFRLGQPARLTKDVVWNADLTHIVQLCSLLDAIRVFRVHAEAFGDNPRVPAYAHDVVPGVVVPIFGRTRKTVQNVPTRRFQFGGATLDSLFERAGIALHLVLMAFQRQQISDSGS